MHTNEVMHAQKACIHLHLDSSRYSTLYILAIHFMLQLDVIAPKVKLKAVSINFMANYRFQVSVGCGGGWLEVDT